MMKRLVLISFAAVTLSGCAEKPAGLPVRIAQGGVVFGGNLRVSESGRPISMAPEHMIGISGNRIGNQIHCGLMRLDPMALTPVPAIAERVETDTTAMRYIFHLRQGVLFHDVSCFGRASREVTAHDVAFSIERICRPGSTAFESTYKGRIAGADLFHDAMTDVIQGLTVLDDYTLSITMVRPDASFLHILAQPVAAVISKRAFEDCGDDNVGVGPFRVAVERDELVLVRNADYLVTDAFGNQLPYLDSVTISFFSSKELALENLLQGRLDLVTGIYLDPVRSLMEQHKDEFTGQNPRLVMQRNDDAAEFEIYAIHSSRLVGFRENFLGHRDFAILQLKQ
jgi:oligopeptide transport system substrate-binding protein